MIIVGRNFIVSAEHDRAIAYWWSRRLDTLDIARKLGLHESQVANRLMHVRQTYRLEERRDVIAQVCGDPPAGRSALDQKRRGE